MALLDPNDPTSGAQLLTEEELANRNRIALLLAKRNASGEVMTSPWQAFAKGFEGLADGVEAKRLKDAQDARATHDAASWASLADAYNGGDTPTTAALTR